MEAGVYRNKKNGKKYRLIGVATSARNSGPVGEEMVVYEALEGFNTGRLFYRDPPEFREKFDKVSE